MTFSTPLGRIYGKGVPFELSVRRKFLAEDSAVNLRFARGQFTGKITSQGLAIIFWNTGKGSFLPCNGVLWGGFKLKRDNLFF